MVIDSLMRRARRRHFVNELLAQGAVALGVAFAGILLLLLLGTQILDWYWLVLAPAVALAVGIYRIVRRMPSQYTLAQRIDQRSGLHDTLSTAYFYLKGRETAAVSDSMMRHQRAMAEREAASVQLERALAFQMPRTMYAVALLAVAASALFAMRYGFSRELDLQPPLASIIQDYMGWNAPVEAAKTQKKQLAKRTPLDDALGMSLPETDQDRGELDAAPENALETVGVPEVDPEQFGGKQAQGKQNSQLPEPEKLEGAPEERPGEGEEGAESDQGEQGKQAQKGKESPANSSQNSSLMAKLKEAMQNLIDKMRQKPDTGGSEQAEASKGQQAKNQKGKGSQKDGSADGKQQAGQESEGEEGQSGDESQTATEARAKGSGEGGEESSSKQPGSGIGKQDGDKDGKAAEQLAAMGKISEIIGKRSQNVTGEMTIEVQSSDQKIKTPYAAGSTEHGEAVGEVSRNEVPVVFQSFVQQYFEQVRKQPAPSKPEARRQAEPKPAESYLDANGQPRVPATRSSAR